MRRTYDCVFIVPASWSFYLNASDVLFYKNADFNEFSENFVPADGMDYEIWLADNSIAG